MPAIQFHGRVPDQVLPTVRSRLRGRIYAHRARLIVVADAVRPVELNRDVGWFIRIIGSAASLNELVQTPEGPTPVVDDVYRQVHGLGAERIDILHLSESRPG